MKNSVKAVIGIFVIAIVVAVLISFQNTAEPGKYDDFAKCLTDKGAIFYGSYWCPHCQSQKQMFGDSVEYVPYVECSLPDKAGQNKMCNDAKIESYPTWEFNDGEKISGLLSLFDLSERTGCTLPD